MPGPSHAEPPLRVELRRIASDGATPRQPVAAKPETGRQAAAAWVLAAVAAPATSSTPAPSPPTSPEPAAADGRPSPPAAASAPAEEFVAPQFAAAYLDNPPPTYPAAARRRGLQGTVQLEVFVGRDGRPRELRLAAGSGATALDEAALAAVHDWRFVPARRGREEVDAWVVVPIRFRLGDSG